MVGSKEHVPRLIANFDKIERASVIWGDVNEELYERVTYLLTQWNNGFFYNDLLMCTYYPAPITVYTRYDDTTRLKFFVMYGPWKMIFNTLGTYDYYNHLGKGCYKLVGQMTFYFRKLKSNVLTHHDITFHFKDSGFKRVVE